MTFKIILRGSPSPTVAAEYHCPTHGRFEIDVERTSEGDAPDSVQCVFDDGADERCLLQCIWCISAPDCRVRKFEVVKGKSEKPAKKTYLDTSDLGEGQPLYEWREKRAEIWETKRKEDVVKFGKEH